MRFDFELKLKFKFELEFEFVFEFVDKVVLCAETLALRRQPILDPRPIEKLQRKIGPLGPKSKQLDEAEYAFGHPAQLPGSATAMLARLEQVGIDHRQTRTGSRSTRPGIAA